MTLPQLCICNDPGLYMHPLLSDGTIVSDLQCKVNYGVKTTRTFCYMIKTSIDKNIPEFTLFANKTLLQKAQNK